MSMCNLCVNFLLLQVLFINSQQRQIMSLMQGHADVAFVRADQPAVLEAAGVLDASSIKVLSSVSHELSMLPFMLPRLSLLCGI